MSVHAYKQPLPVLLYKGHHLVCRNFPEGEAQGRLWRLEDALDCLSWPKCSRLLALLIEEDHTLLVRLFWGTSWDQAGHASIEVG